MSVIRGSVGGAVKSAQTASIANSSSLSVSSSFSTKAATSTSSSYAITSSVVYNSGGSLNSSGGISGSKLYVTGSGIYVAQVINNVSNGSNWTQMNLINNSDYIAGFNLTSQANPMWGVYRYGTTGNNAFAIGENGLSEVFCITDVSHGKGVTIGYGNATDSPTNGLAVAGNTFISGNTGLGQSTASVTLEVLGGVRIREGQIQGTGTCDIDGAGNVTGTGTKFTSELHVGDTFTDDNTLDSSIVSSITDDATMTVSSGETNSGFSFHFTPPAILVNDGTITVRTQRIGINKINPASELDVVGTINATVTVISPTFQGNLIGNADTATSASSALFSTSASLSLTSSRAITSSFSISSSRAEIAGTANALSFTPSTASNANTSSWALNSQKVNVSATASNNAYPLVFTLNSGSQTFFMDDTGSAITYNPGSNTLTVASHIGTSSYASASISSSYAVSASRAETAGLANTATSASYATSASRAEIAGTANAISFTPATASNANTSSWAINSINIGVNSTASNINYPLVFTLNSGSQPLLMDDTGSAITYNPSTNTLTVASHIGTSSYASASISSSYSVSASYATTAGSASGLFVATYAITSSQSVSSSYAVSASWAANNYGYAKISQVVNSGTDGTAFPTRTWSSASFNTINTDTLSAFSLTNNVITVNAAGAGVWRVNACLPIIDYTTSPTQGSRARVRRTNNTATTLILGQTGYSSAYITTNPPCLGLVTLSAGDTLEIQGWCENSTPQFGKLNVSSGDQEVYSIVEFEKKG